MKKVLASMLALAGAAASVNAQSYETGGATVAFQVNNGSGWGSNADVTTAGTTVQWRVVISYTGASNLFALGEAYTQPVFTGVDISGASDSVNAGVAASGNNIANSMVGQPGSSQTTGRNFPYGNAAMQASTFNAMTVYSGNAGSDANGPADSFFRIAGSGATTFARDEAATTTVVAADLQNILRGVAHNQTSEALNPGQNEPGTSGLVVMSGTFTVSADAIAANRVVTLNGDARNLRRVGNATSTDNRRYIAWQTSNADTGTGAGGHRTVLDDSAFSPATITILVPTPGSVALLGLGGLVAARRRRA